MSDEHWSDERIREFPDARLQGADAFLPWHLRNGPACARRLGENRRLYGGLAADPGFALSPVFTAALLAKRASPLPLPRGRRFLLAFAFAALGLAAVLGLAQLADLDPLAQNALRIPLGLGLAFRSLSAPLGYLFSLLDGAAKPFLIGLLGLAAATALERFLLRAIPRPRS